MKIPPSRIFEGNGTNHIGVNRIGFTATPMICGNVQGIVRIGCCAYTCNPGGIPHRILAYATELNANSGEVFSSINELISPYAISRSCCPGRTPFKFRSVIAYIMSAIGMDSPRY